jgi:hypothetical protein
MRGIFKAVSVNLGRERDGRAPDVDSVSRPCWQGCRCQHETTGGRVRCFAHDHLECTALSLPFTTRHYLSVLLERPRKRTKKKNSQYNRYLARDLNSRPSEYGAGVSSAICCTDVSFLSRSVRNTRHLNCAHSRCPAPQSIQNLWYEAEVLEELLQAS